MMKRRTGLCLAGVILLWQAAMAQTPPNVQVNFDNAQILIGDHFQLTVDIAAEPGTNIEVIQYPQWADGKVEILEEAPLNTIAQTPQLLMQQRVLLTSFDTGYHRMPPLAVIYSHNGIRDTAYGGNLGLTVATLPVEESADLRDNKDIIAEPLRAMDALPYVLATLLLVFLIRYWRQRKARTFVAPAAPPPPPIPAHERALAQLDALAADAAWERGDIKGFQSELTYILREYLEARFQINALEATTPEILRDVQRLPVMTHHTAVLQAVLERADRVKFAKAVPPQQEHPAAWAAVRDFVTQTAEPPAPNHPPTETNAPQT